MLLDQTVDHSHINGNELLSATEFMGTLIEVDWATAGWEARVLLLADSMPVVLLHVAVETELDRLCPNKYGNVPGGTRQAGYTVD